MGKRSAKFKIGTIEIIDEKEVQQEEIIEDKKPDQQINL